MGLTSLPTKEKHEELKEKRREELEKRAQQERQVKEQQHDHILFLISYSLLVSFSLW